MPQTRTQRAASQAVAAWLAYNELSTAWLVHHAEVDPGTVGTFLAGNSWPKVRTQGRIERALGWPPGTIHQIGFQGAVADDLIRSTPPNVGGDPQDDDRTTDQADYVAAPGDKTHGGVTDAELLETLRDLREAVDKLNDRLDRDGK